MFNLKETFLYFYIYWIRNNIIPKLHIAMKMPNIKFIDSETIHPIDIENKGLLKSVNLDLAVAGSDINDHIDLKAYGDNVKLEVIYCNSKESCPELVITPSGNSVVAMIRVLVYCETSNGYEHRLSLMLGYNETTACTLDVFSIPSRIIKTTLDSSNLIVNKPILDLVESLSSNIKVMPFLNASFNKNALRSYVRIMAKIDNALLPKILPHVLIPVETGETRLVNVYPKTEENLETFVIKNMTVDKIMSSSVILQFHPVSTGSNDASFVDVYKHIGE